MSSLADEVGGISGHLCATGRSRIIDIDDGLRRAEANPGRSRARERAPRGVRARVATPRMLYRMKKDTVRPQDRLDAETIRARFGLKDE